MKKEDQELRVVRTVSTEYGGNIWRIEGEPEITEEAAASVVRDFLAQDSKAEADWTLSVYDIDSGDKIEINCRPQEFAEVVAKVCMLEWVHEMDFIADSPGTGSCVVGLGCSCRNLRPVRRYEYKDGDICEIPIGREALEKKKKRSGGFFSRRQGATR